MQGRTRTRRAQGIKTRKVSISVSEEDLRILTARAAQAHGGNLSAVIHEMAATVARENAMDKLLEMFSDVVVTEEAMQAIRDEIDGIPSPAPARRKRGTAA